MLNVSLTMQSSSPFYFDNIQYRNINFTRVADATTKGWNELTSPPFYIKCTDVYVQEYPVILYILNLLLCSQSKYIQVL